MSWTICKSLAHYFILITMPPPHCSSFLRAECSSCRPTNSVKALKVKKKYVNATDCCSVVHSCPKLVEFTYLTLNGVFRAPRPDSWTWAPQSTAKAAFREDYKFRKQTQNTGNMRAVPRGACTCRVNTLKSVCCHLTAPCGTASRRASPLHVLSERTLSHWQSV